jgi:flagellar biogenesis protein FliO
MVLGLSMESRPGAAWGRGGGEKKGMKDAHDRTIAVPTGAKKSWHGHCNTSAYRHATCQKTVIAHRKFIMQSLDWVQFIASTLSVFALLGGALWWVKRNKGLGGTMQGDRRIQVLEALPLSLKHKMVLIQVDQQMVLASVSPGEVKTLHAWKQESSDAT